MKDALLSLATIHPGVPEKKLFKDFHDVGFYDLFLYHGNNFWQSLRH